MRPIELLPAGVRVSLAEWNDHRARLFAEKRERAMRPQNFPNGLQCPCGGDLYDTGQFTPGHPGTLRVKCMECDFKGERYE